MNVHKMKTMNQASFLIPCPNGCTGEDRLEMMDRVGHWTNTLPGNVGAMSLFGLIPGAVVVWAQCDYCDIEAMILADFPDASQELLPPPFKQFDARRTNVTNAYQYARARGNLFTAYQHDNTQPMTWEDNKATNGRIPLTVSSWFMKEHHSEVMDAFRPMLEEDPSIVTWIVDLGHAVDGIDSAESNHKDATIVWSTGSLSGGESVYPIQNRLMPSV